MSKEKSFQHYLWAIVRRSCTYMFSGALMGAIVGAACISLAGCIIGLGTITTQGMDAFGIAMFGGILGLILGAAVGGIIGLIGWGVVGLIYPASSMLSTENELIGSTTVWMRNATIFAIGCYFSWCVCVGFIRRGFGAAVDDYLYIALFGVPAIMGIGQIVGIWCAANKLGNSQSETK